MSSLITVTKIPDDAICLFKHAGKWCCVRRDFEDLYRSPAGFGDSVLQAIDDFDLETRDQFMVDGTGIDL